MSKTTFITLEVPMSSLQIDYEVNVEYNTTEAWGQVATQKEHYVEINEVKWGDTLVDEYDEEALSEYVLKEYLEDGYNE